MWKNLKTGILLLILFLIGKHIYDDRHTEVKED